MEFECANYVTHGLPLGFSIQPIPAVVRVTAEYTDDAGASFRSTLEDLRIDFGDLYCEPMYPPHWPAEGGACYAYRLALFDQLWAFIEERVNAEDEEVRAVVVLGEIRME